MGHNLGSGHDGDSGATDCPSSDNFIMSPSQSFDKIQNMQKFSACSIRQFKNLLLVNNGFLFF